MRKRLCFMFSIIILSIFLTVNVSADVGPKFPQLIVIVENPPDDLYMVLMVDGEEIKGTIKVTPFGTFYDFYSFKLGYMLSNANEVSLRIGKYSFYEIKVIPDVLKGYDKIITLDLINHVNLIL